MKIANLLLYVIVLFAAWLITWLVFNHFPFAIIPHDTIGRFFDGDLPDMLRKSYDYRASIILEYGGLMTKALVVLDWGQHVVAYLIAGAASMVVLRRGEKHIFAVLSQANWKVVVPLWFLPILCLGTELAPHPYNYYSFLIIADFTVIGLLGIYALWYHGVRALRVKSEAR